jgi:hypothetical protein
VLPIGVAFASEPVAIRDEQAANDGGAAAGRQTAVVQHLKTGRARIGIECPRQRLHGNIEANRLLDGGLIRRIRLRERVRDRRYQ